MLIIKIISHRCLSMLNVNFQKLGLCYKVDNQLDIELNVGIYHEN